jgi:hypothetical protein
VPEILIPQLYLLKLKKKWRIKIQKTFLNSTNRREPFNLGNCDLPTDVVNFWGNAVARTVNLGGAYCDTGHGVVLQIKYLPIFVVFYNFNSSMTQF